MGLLVHENLPPPCAFASLLELNEFPHTFFRLQGYLNGKPVAKAFGDFRPYGAFRLIRIDVCEDQGCRRRGYATAMIRRLINVANENSCDTFVFIGVDTSNQAAIQLYSRLGAVAQPITNCSKKVDYVYRLVEALEYS